MNVEKLKVMVFGKRWHRINRVERKWKSARYLKEKREFKYAMRVREFYILQREKQKDVIDVPIFVR